MNFSHYLSQWVCMCKESVSGMLSSLFFSCHAACSSSGVRKLIKWVLGKICLIVSFQTCLCLKSKLISLLFCNKCSYMRVMIVFCLYLHPSRYIRKLDYVLLICVYTFECVILPLAKRDIFVTAAAEFSHFFPL